MKSYIILLIITAILFTGVSIFNISLLQESNNLKEINSQLVIFNRHQENSISNLSNKLSDVNKDNEALTVALEIAEKENFYYQTELRAYKEFDDFELYPIVSEEEINMLAQTMLGEAGGKGEFHMSMVAWCILNRVDSGKWGNRVAGVILAPYQFHGYISTLPVLPEIKKLAEDIVIRWRLEKECGWDAGRTLPAEFMYFHASKGYNAFYKFNGTERVYYNWNNQYNPYNPTRE